MSLTTGILIRRLGLFVSLARRMDGIRVVMRGRRSRGRGILRVAVRRLSLSIESCGYLGETKVGAIRRLTGGSRSSVVGIEGLKGGSLRRMVRGLRRLKLNLGPDRR